MTIPKRAAVVLVPCLTLLACSGSAGVTERDFLRAAEAAADCLEGRGFEAIGPDLGAGGFGYVLGVYTEPGVSDSVREDGVDALVECWDQHVGDLEAQFYEGLALSGDSRERDFEAMIACLEAAGVSGIEVGDTEETVGTAVGENVEAIGCLQAHLWQLFRGVNDPDR